MRERGLKPFYLSPPVTEFVVAPHAGAWIETSNGAGNTSDSTSLPMRERGLKLPQPLPGPLQYVAPHAGAWIETFMNAIAGALREVAPHAGAWIETANPLYHFHTVPSLPMRERGLKLKPPVSSESSLNVAPHAGAWIETI